jgi:aspartate/methionine/tyrosine aminotransferase
MHWAKDRERAAFHLGASGTPSPPSEEVAAFFDSNDDAASSAGDRHGFGDLRAAIAAAHGVTEDSVLVSDGASLANYATLAVAAGPGDRVLVETPTYGVLEQIPRFHGAEVERLARRPEDAWTPPLDAIAAAAARPGAPLRAVVLTRLHNPSGTNLAPEFLEQLARVAEAHSLHVLFDEAYLDFVDETPAHRFSPRFLSTGSLTKGLGFGGLRIGWVIAAPRTLAPVREFSFYLAVNASAPAQRAAVRILAKRAHYVERARRIAARGRAIVDAWLASRDDVSWVAPAGGLIGFIRLHRVEDTEAFASRLLAEADVAVAAGEHFGMGGWVRVGFGAEESSLREGLARMGRALDDLRD